MDRGDDAGPCPLCEAPTKVVEYDEAPWGARGNYIFSCEKCGEYRDVIKDPAAPAPVTYIFQDPASELRYRVANATDEELRKLWDKLSNLPEEPPDIQFSDKAIPAPVDMVINVVDGFIPGKLHIHEFTSIKTRLPAGATLLSEMPSKPKPPEHCWRCGRLTETCNSGLYGDCIDYRRR